MSGKQIGAGARPALQIETGHSLKEAGLHKKGRVGLLLFGSGFCALTYQVVWLREMRLVFGASTAASSAVLAIFMGGLGLGSALLGQRTDTKQRPLRFYGRLELFIATTAAVTPFWMVLLRHGYALTGGVAQMGTPIATAVRMLMALPIIGLPTFIMGGTLPAAARAVVGAEDASRGPLAYIYGLNTLGAVFGATLATFFMLEIFGTRNTLWIASLINALIGFWALSLDRKAGKGIAAGMATAPQPRPAGSVQDDGAAKKRAVHLAAAATGFVFFIMELVWYRMLGPLLGGTTYTFGLILAMALAGIGIGGAAYSMRSRSHPATMKLFALTVALEALFLAIPYAAGDWIAVITALLGPLGGLGLGGRALAWTLVAGFVIFPAAAVSGFQFPLLISFMGQGRKKVGGDTGHVYAWNTMGSISGSLAGGFGLMGLLSAVGVWRAGVGLLGLLAITAMWASMRQTRQIAGHLAPALALVLALVLLLADGPSAAWRHSPVGAGRVDLTRKGPNEIRDWINGFRRHVIWQSDGIEASVGIDNREGLAFTINGKVDGNAKMDAPTQVMLGLIGAALHPSPRTALVVGLGTGSTAGWLAEVATMERVEVAELEPDIRHMARACATVNRNAMDNPKVSVILSDAREVLFNSTNIYDLIVSEPSNPYRAGIASLYTTEFYEAAKARLRPDGFFTQWVQAYEIDGQTMNTIYGTLGAVFSHVETWQSQGSDLVLVCSDAPPEIPAGALRKRLGTEPFGSAMTAVWGAVDLEGFLARFLANADFARQVSQTARARGLVNTDDRTLIEFGFARTVGKLMTSVIQTVTESAHRAGMHRPRWIGPGVDWAGVDENRLLMDALEGRVPAQWKVNGVTSLRRLFLAFKHFSQSNSKACLDEWDRSGFDPEYPLEMAMVGHCLADQGNPSALEIEARLAPLWPMDAAAIAARLHLRKKAYPETLAALEQVFVRLRTDPWISTPMLYQAMMTARQLFHSAPGLARDLHALLEKPFAVRMIEGSRMQFLLEVASGIDFFHGAAVVRQFEPHVPWREDFLRYRLFCYTRTADPLAGQAESDLDRFLRAAPVDFDAGFSK